jgi:3'-phosphoadenosine 5'-phosphosulfate sulfotransferase (PAPS reductase)/FAD synthetase
MASDFKPDPAKTYVVSISGGKDSTALWLHLKYDLKLPNIVPVFADTQWEHDLTYEYLDYLEGKLGKLHRVKADLGFVDLAKKKKRFPSTKARFCTTELKLRPVKKWVNESIASGLLPEDFIMVVGVRAEESPSRAKLPEYAAIDDFYGVPQWRPIIRWTWKQVFMKHAEHGIDVNPLYKQGMGRVGCMPCIMSNKGELRHIAERFPDVFDKVGAAEREVKKVCTHYSFWPSGYIPARFCSFEWTNEKDGKVHNIPTADDVKKYVLLEKAEKQFGGELPKLFPEMGGTGVCTSVYGLCE